MLDWKPTPSSSTRASGLDEMDQQEQLEYLMELRKRFPEDKELANLDHEVFMRGRSVGAGLALPPLYYAIKKFLQSTPELEAIGRKATLGGLLDRPILDDDTTPASLDQMLHGMWGALRPDTKPKEP